MINPGEKKMKVNKKKAVALGLLFGFIGLTGCHQNPMIKHTNQKSVGLLLKASQLAEKQLKMERASGWAYENCMDDNRAELDCAAFFKVMLPFVKKNERFKSMILADLMNKDAFEPIADDYASQRFMSLY